MTSQEMLADLAGRLGDVAMNQFTELELRHWLNAGQRDVQRRLEGINAEWYLVDYYIAGVAGTSYYGLPTACKALRVVRVGRGMWTTNSTYESFARRIPLQEWAKTIRNEVWVASEQDPNYLQVGDGFIIEPTVGVSVADGIRIVYTKRVDDLTAFTSGEVSGIRPEYHDLVVDYAEMVARRRIAQDTSMMQQAYEAAFQQIKTSIDRTETITP